MKPTKDRKKYSDLKTSKAEKFLDDSWQHIARMYRLIVAQKYDPDSSGNLGLELKKDRNELIETMNKRLAFTTVVWAKYLHSEAERAKVPTPVEESALPVSADKERLEMHLPQAEDEGPPAQQIGPPITTPTPALIPDTPTPQLTDPDEAAEAALTKLLGVPSMRAELELFEGMLDGSEAEPEEPVDDDPIHDLE